MEVLHNYSVSPNHHPTLNPPKTPNIFTKCLETAAVGTTQSCNCSSCCWREINQPRSGASNRAKCILTSIGRRGCHARNSSFLIIDCLSLSYGDSPPPDFPPLLTDSKPGLFCILTVSHCSVLSRVEIFDIFCRAFQYRYLPTPTFLAFSKCQQFY